MYILNWTTRSDGQKAAVNVPVASMNSADTPIRLTGKGFPNYGVVQQENMMRMLENFAGPDAPLHPTEGMTWFQTSTILADTTIQPVGVLKVAAVDPTTGDIVWRSLGGVQATQPDAGAPNPALIGDMWTENQSSSTNTNSFPSATGSTYVYTGRGRHPVSYVNGVYSIGGWNQMWPQIEITAGREEYDMVANLVNQLAGPMSGGGNGMIASDNTGSDGAVPALMNLDQLDASLVTAFKKNSNGIASSNSTDWDSSTLTPTSAADPAVVTDVNEYAANIDALKVDVTSQDWDSLLAVARKAVDRLDMPPGSTDFVSAMPFVSDGRPVPKWLADLPSTDIMYPTLERRVNRRYGSATLNRAFTETVNVLNNAILNRYSLKGITGTNGANPTVTPTNQTRLIYNAILTGVTYDETNFARATVAFANESYRDSFMLSGGCIEIDTSLLAQGASPSASDTAMAAMTAALGVVRVTYDKTRIFNHGGPEMTANPVALGFANIISGLDNSGASLVVDGEGFITMSSQSLGTSSVKVLMKMNTTTTFDVKIIFKDTSGVQAAGGNMTIKINQIIDNATKKFGTSAAFFATPQSVLSVTTPTGFTAVAS